MNNKSSGCLGIFVVLFVIWLVAWLFKIGVILAGVALIVGAPLAAIVFCVRRWREHRMATEAVAAREKIAADFTELEVASIARLGEEMAQWDRIQLTRGVGTTLESAYFTGQAAPDIQRQLRKANELMESGERLRNGFVPGDLGTPLAQRIQHLSQIDSAWIQLELERARITPPTS